MPFIYIYTLHIYHLYIYINTNGDTLVEIMLPYSAPCLFILMLLPLALHGIHRD